MSQQWATQSDKPVFEQKSDAVFRISLVAAFAVVGALGIAQWASKPSKVHVLSAPASSVQAKASGAESVYKCADHSVSFKPC